MPLVSVITPTYNAEAWIGRAIHSVLAQTMDDLEMIIVDDGSTDGTLDAIRAIGDKRIHTLSQKNQERSAARNAAMAVATGEYFAFLDADDWWVPEKLARQLALFRDDPSLGLVYCAVQQIAPDGSPLRLAEMYTDSDLSRESVLQRSLLSNIFGPSSALLIPGRIAGEIGPFRTDLVYLEDWDYCLRIANRYPIGFVPDVLAFYQLHGAYMPPKLARLNLPDKAVTLVSDHIALSGIDPQSALARQALANAYWWGALALAGVPSYTGTNDRISRALALDPDSYIGPGLPAAQSIGYYANALYDALTPLDVAVQYVEALFDHLAGSATALAPARRAALSWTHAVHAFEGIALDRPERVRASFWKAIAYDPGWLRNLGLVSHGVKSWLPGTGRS